MPKRLPDINWMAALATILGLIVAVLTLIVAILPYVRPPEIALATATVASATSAITATLTPSLTTNATIVSTPNTQPTTAIATRTATPVPPTPTMLPTFTPTPSPTLPTAFSECNSPLPLLDDFNHPSLDSAVWKPGDGAAGNYSISNNQLVFSATESANGWPPRALSFELSGREYDAVEATFTLQSVVNGRAAIGLAGHFGEGANNHTFFQQLWANTPIKESLIEWKVWNVPETYVASNNEQTSPHFIDFPSTHVLRIVTKLDETLFCVDGMQVGRAASRQATKMYGTWIQLQYQLSQGASIKAAVDNFRIRYHY